LAAPGDKKTRICEKCFATVDANAPYCPECGAPMGGAAGGESSDSTIYPLLAQSNLLRMRGEYKQAEDVCLRILKQLPNNASAHTLLGDICAERGDLEQAVQWYELSLDITPDSKAERTKLAAVKQRIHDRDTAATAEQIGLPSKQTNFTVPIVAAVILMAVVGIGAFFAGQKANNTPKTPVVDVSSTGGGVPRIDAGATSETGGTPNPEQQAAAMWRDDLFTRSLADQLGETARLADAWQDPRSQNIVITVTAAAEDKPRDLAARLGAATLQQVPAASVVTVRVVQSGALVLIADVNRSALPPPTGENPTAPSPDVVLSNEWPAAPSATTTTTTTQTTGNTATTGGTHATTTTGGTATTTATTGTTSVTGTTSTTTGTTGE
jgi:hypothetical protein